MSLWASWAWQTLLIEVNLAFLHLLVLIHEEVSVIFTVTLMAGFLFVCWFVVESQNVNLQTFLQIGHPRLKSYGFTECYTISICRIALKLYKNMSITARIRWYSPKHQLEGNRRKEGGSKTTWRYGIQTMGILRK